MPKRLTTKQAAKRYKVTEELVRIMRGLPNYDPFLQAEDCYIDTARLEERLKYLENHIKQTDGKNPGCAFPFQPWQLSIVCNLYGWYRQDESRRYRKCFIYVPKKNGKSAFTAALICLELKLSEELNGEIYSAAAAQKQTNNVFKHVKGMVILDNELGADLQVYGGNAGIIKKIVNERTGTEYKCLAADAGTVDGLHPTLNVIDELHRHRNAELSEVLEKSTAARVSPLTIITTTADYDRKSLCNDTLYRARRICENDGDLNKPGYAPEFLPVVYEIRADDYHDDPADSKPYWQRQEVWRKANPNLNVTVSTDNFKEMVREAIDMPSQLNNFLRLHLNVIVGQAISWLDMQAYDRCKPRPELSTYNGHWGYAGLDMSSTKDITAYTLSFKNTDNGIDTYGWYWIPEETAYNYERQLDIPFSRWAEDGYITLTSGNYIDDELVQDSIIEINKEFDVKEIMTDPWNAASTINRLTKEGQNPVEFRQGYKSFNWPTKKLEQLVLSGNFRHGDNPVLRWMFSNVIVTHDAGNNIKPDKSKSEQKIDGAVAAIMSIAPHFPAEDEEEKCKPSIFLI